MMRQEGASQHEVVVSVTAYTLCSSLAIVANKICISHVPLPGFIFVLQLLVTIAFIQLGRAFRLLEADDFTWSNVKTFIPYICSFVVSLYSNGRALATANIETVIVFRSMSPLCVCVLDWAFLGRELPSARSALALLGVVVGAIGYVRSDSQFGTLGIAAYKWVIINLCGIVFEMTYGKSLISGIKFSSPVWGSVLYTNALALPPMLLVALSTGEATRLADVELDEAGASWLIVSCVIGVGISWAGWNCRAKITATAYTLLGVVCKFISVFLNVLIWDKHATPTGLSMLMITMVCSTFYQQAPLRKEPQPQMAIDEEELEMLKVASSRSESKQRHTPRGKVAAKLMGNADLDETPHFGEPRALAVVD
jgi:GDP-mannose transporter